MKTEGSDIYEEIVLVNDDGKPWPFKKKVQVKIGTPTIRVVTTVEVVLPTDVKPKIRNAVHTFSRGLTRGDGKIIYNYRDTKYEDIDA